ncbi:MAG: SBBP repeat-containing protein [Bacteroidetes bacterium]|nr:SBBP repeat-containing protein [Bacteroidota bacterium]
MKKICLGLLVSLLTTAVHSQVVNFEWANSMGGISNDVGQSIATDALGNLYITGHYEGTADFDPSAATFYLTSNGFWDIFIQKFDALGNFIWVKSMGGTLYDEGQSITIDASGNLYITGRYLGTVDFDPGAATFNLTSNGQEDIFIQKLDTGGNFIWAKSIGGTSGDFGYSITTDASGNVYVTGIYQNTVDFDPGAATFNLTSNGLNDVFIQKLDGSGNFIWAKSVGGIFGDKSNSITLDASGNVYITGYYVGTVDFDPGAATFNISSNGSGDVFIQKLTAGGNFVWAKSIGGTLLDEGKSITTDASGNVLITGYYDGTMDFDPGAATFSLTSNGNDEIFIEKLDASGNFIWAKSVGSTSFDGGNSIATDTSNNVLITGYFGATVDFDPGASTFNLTSNGLWDAFIQKLDAAGNFIWAKSMGGTIGDEGFSIITDASGNVFVTGNYETTVDFDPGASTFNLTSNGSYDAFVQMLSQCTPNTGTDVITACDSYTWIDANTYSASNNSATHTLTNSGGCDSVVTLNLTINNSNTGTDVLTSCDSLTWIDNNTYITSNNTATHTLTNATGCDSVVTLNLTITASSTGTDVITACDSYTWIDGNMYTSSNNSATHTLTNSGGCDSVVTLNLTINTVNVGVSASDPTITANATGAVYQWLDCNNNYVAITGATVQSFTASKNGFYAVEVTNNGCTDTSVCVTISTLSIEENPLFYNVSIFPNPNSGLVNIDLGNLRDVSIRVYTVTGQLVYQAANINASIHQFEFKEPAGVYFVEVGSKGVKRRYKLVKE